MNSHPKVDTYIQEQTQWYDELKAIRSVLKTTELDEDIKWGIPTYCIDGKNVLSFSGFKNHFGIWFHQGAFLNDKYGILVNAQKGKTRGMRQLKYTNEKEIDLDIIRSYVLEAIQNHKDGKSIKPTKTTIALDIPEIIKINLSENGLKQLLQLSIAKRNQYIEYITSAKREATKLKRIETINPMIELGRGLHDQYKKIRPTK